MKAPPRRKTDVKDAEWIADLFRHGLLKASFIPSREQRELRELIRYRKSLIEERSRELNRLQKILEGANIKLSSVVKDINGVSSRKLLEKIIAEFGTDMDRFPSAAHVSSWAGLSIFLLYPPDILFPQFSPPWDGLFYHALVRWAFS